MYRKSALLLRGIAILAILCGCIAGCNREYKITDFGAPNAPGGSLSLMCYLVQEGGSWKIKILDPASNSVIQIADIGGNEVRGLAWSPDKSKIAFASDRSGTIQIWVIDDDGSDITQVTGLAGSCAGAVSFDPCWEDTNYLVYTSLRLDFNRCEIARIRIDGTQQQALVIYDGSCYCYSSPCLSTDFTKFACNVSVPINLNQSSILVANYPNFGNKHIVSIPGQNAGNPKWSNDGLLVFDEASSGIYTVSPNGAQLQNISGLEHPGDRLPVFSPNGGQIAFLSAESGEPNVYIMNVDGTNRQQITYEITGNLISYLDW
jgi:Tol biopolymer transport system component